ncbi:MAG: hypothetical protein JO055_10460 [Alphaproteobacteria bacterium]|nr:hypothetical protein [Alphaproteobacteria bacterium]
MTTKPLSLTTITFICSHCACGSEQPVMWLVEHPTFHCPRCGHLIEIHSPDANLSGADRTILNALRTVTNKQAP